MSNFLNKSVSERKSEVLRILKKYPEKVPVIIIKEKGCTVTEPTNTKFLIPKELTVAQFLYTLRTRILLAPDQALFLSFGSKKEMPANTDQMSHIYECYRNTEDEMLYAIYNTESTFG